MNILKKLTTLLLTLATLLLITATTIASLADSWYLGELLVSLSFYWFLASLMALILTTILKNKKLSLILIFLLLTNLWRIKPVQIATKTKAQHQTIKLVFANVLFGNDNYQGVADKITPQNPDIILLTEVRPHMVDDYTQVFSNWPQTKYIESIDDIPDDAKKRNYYSDLGMLLLSKPTITKVETFFPPGAFRPIMTAKLETPQGNFTLMGIHPFPPVSKGLFQSKSALLSTTDEFVVQNSADPIVLAGDFNTTTYSPWFHQLLEESSLKESRASFPGTWPTWLPTFLRLPIDHILVSNQINVHQSKILPQTNSDHLPILLEFTIK